MSGKYSNLLQLSYTLFAAIAFWFQVWKQCTRLSIVIEIKEDVQIISDYAAHQMAPVLSLELTWSLYKARRNWFIKTI